MQYDSGWMPFQIYSNEEIIVGCGKTEHKIIVVEMLGKTVEHDGKRTTITDMSRNKGRSDRTIFTTIKPIDDKCENFSLQVKVKKGDSIPIVSICFTSAMPDQRLQDEYQRTTVYYDVFDGTISKIMNTIPFTTIWKKTSAFTQMIKDDDIIDCYVNPISLSENRYHLIEFKKNGNTVGVHCIKECNKIWPAIVTENGCGVQVEVCVNISKTYKSREKEGTILIVYIRKFQFYKKLYCVFFYKL